MSDLLELEDTKLQNWRGATVAITAGLLISVALLVMVIIDQTSIHSLAHHVEAQYGPHDLHPDPNVLFGYVYVIGAFGFALQLVALRGARRRKRWVQIVAGLIALVGVALAAFTIIVSEFGERIFPAIWGALGLLPSVAGLVAVTLLWTSGRGRDQS